METIDQSGVSRDAGRGVEDNSPHKASIPSDPYAKVTRLLSDEEMGSTAVLKLLLSENDRQGREIDRLKEIEEKYYKRDKEAAVLEEKLMQSTRSEVLFTVCEACGSALAGVSGIYWENKGWIFLLVGLLLVIGGLIYKFVKK